MAKRNIRRLSESQQRIANVRRDPERYARLGIVANPFPAAGLAPSNPQVEPLPSIRERIISFLTRFLESGSSNGLVLLGSYGAGKTYHLNYVRSVLEYAIFNIRIVHIVDPGIHPYHVIRSILLNIGEEEIATMVWGIISPYLKEQHENNPSFFDNMIARTGSGKRGTAPYGQGMLNMFISRFSDETWSDHRLFLRELNQQLVLDREKLVQALLPVLTGPDDNRFITPIKRIAEDLLGVCLYDGIPALERWNAMTEGVGPGAIQPGNEPQFLTALLHLLKKSGVEYFVLLLDEFEKVPQLERMTDKDARLYLDTLRMLIDAGHRHLPFAYIVGSNPDAWRLAVEKITPLQDRFERIELPSMIDDAAAHDIVEAYLDGVRLEDFDKPNPVFPFPSDFPAMIPADSRRTTRQLVKLCHNLIELTIELDKNAIDTELINEILTGTWSIYSE